MHELIYTFESLPLLSFFLLLLAPLLLIALVTFLIANEIRLKRNKISGYKGKVKFDKQYWRLFSVAIVVATLSVLAIPLTVNLLDLKVTKSVTLNVSPLDSNSTKVYKNAYELIQGENILVCAPDLFCLTFPKGTDPQAIIEKVSLNGSNNPQLVGEGAKP